MFWTILKWGTTAVVLIVFGAALFRTAASGSEASGPEPATGAQAPAPSDAPPKKFNF